MWTTCHTARADEIILAALYPKGHPYSWSVIGSMADLSAASLDDVKNFFRTYYAPNNATLVDRRRFRSCEVEAPRQLSTSDEFRAVRHCHGDRRVPAVVMPKDTFMVLEDKVQLPRAFYNWPTVKLFAHG